MTIKDLPPSQKTPMGTTTQERDLEAQTDMIQDVFPPSSSSEVPASSILLAEVATPYHVPVAREAPSPYEGVGAAAPVQTPPRFVPRDDKINLCDAYLLTVVFGLLGAIHFRMGRYWIGFLYVFTLGGFGLGWVVDMMRMEWLVAAYNNGEDFANSDTALVGDAYAMYALGFTGLHQLVLGRPKWALAYLCTVGFLGVGWLVDLFRMSTLTPSKVRRLPSGEPCYSLVDAYICWLPLGLWGGHHYYLGNKTRAVLYTCTIGFFGLGFVIDMFIMVGLVHSANVKLAEEHRAQRLSGMKPLLPVQQQQQSAADSAGASASARNLTSRQLNQLAKSEIA